MNLRQIVDGLTALADKNPKAKNTLKQGDQVVVKKRMGNTRLASHEVMAATIVSFTEGGTKAVVSIPRPGGRQLRTTVPVDQLSTASEVFHRNRVQINPAFRGSV